MTDMTLTEALKVVKGLADQHKALGMVAEALAAASTLEARVADLKAQESQLASKVANHQKMAADTEAAYLGTVQHYNGLTQEEISKHQKTVDDAARKAGAAHTRAEAEIKKLGDMVAQAQSDHDGAIQSMAAERLKAENELRQLKDELAAFKNRLQVA